MRYVVNVSLWDAIVAATLMAGVLNPVLMTIQVIMSIWFVSDGEWPNYFESPIAIGLVGIAGVAFYLILFQFGMLLLSTLVCVFSPKMKRGILGEHIFEIRDEGLFESTPFNEALHKWNAIDKVKRLLWRHFVRVGGTNWFVIPDRSFPSKREAIDFAHELRSRMQA